MQGPTPARSFALGRSFLGAATLASGLLQLVIGDFVRLVPPLPAWVPAHSALAYVTGVVLVVLGLAILSGRGALEAAGILGALIVAMVVLLWVPALWVSPGIDRPWLRGFMWTNPLKALALVGGASILVGRIAGRSAEALVPDASDREAGTGRGLPAGDVPRRLRRSALRLQRFRHHAGAVVDPGAGILDVLGRRGPDRRRGRLAGTSDRPTGREPVGAHDLPVGLPGAHPSRPGRPEPRQRDSGSLRGAGPERSGSPRGRDPASSVGPALQTSSPSTVRARAGQRMVGQARALRPESRKLTCGGSSRTL